FPCIQYLEPPDFPPSGTHVRTREREWTFGQSLRGEHQSANAALAVAAVEELCHHGLVITETAARKGLSTVQWPARFELIPPRPRAVLDCAHNVASAEALVNTLRYSFLPRPRGLIFAVSSDKDVSGMFRVLAPEFRRFYLTRYTNSSRAVPPDRLAAL